MSTGPDFAPDFSFRQPDHAHVNELRAPLPPTIKDVEDLPRWRQEHKDAGAQVEDLAWRRSRILSSASIEEIQRHDAALSTARVRVERAASVIAEAEARFAERAERQRVAQPERWKKRKAALAARDEAERIIREVYGPAAEMIAQTLTKLTELESIIDAAGEPPEGEARAPSGEAFRYPPDQYCTWQPLTREVRLPPVVLNEPRFWPPRS